MTPHEAAEHAADAVVHMSAETVTRLVDSLTSEPPVAVRHVIDTAVPSQARAAIRALVAALAPSEAAAVLAGAAIANRRRVEATDLVEIVWTGPETVAVPARPTQSVVDDLIATAESHITLATYSAGDVSDIIRSLNRKRTETPGFDIRLLLEQARTDGTGPDPLADFAALVPYVHALVWPRQSRLRGDYSNMHVKVVIRDRSAALITSANISEAARTHNMELGVLVTGPNLPARLREHFDELETRGHITPP